MARDDDILQAFAQQQINVTPLASDGIVQQQPARLSRDADMLQAFVGQSAAPQTQMVDPRQLVLYRDFSGGWVTDIEPENLADNQLAQADNVVILPNGSLAKRNGLSLLMATPRPIVKMWNWAGKNAILAILQGDNNNLAQLIDIDTVSWSYTVVHDLLSTKCAVSFTQDQAYIIDGHYYLRYDGNKCYDVIPPAISTYSMGCLKMPTPLSITELDIDTLPDATNELPIGTYKMMLTFVNIIDGTVVESSGVVGTCSVVAGQSLILYLTGYVLAYDSKYSAPMYVRIYATEANGQEYHLMFQDEYSTVLQPNINDYYIIHYNNQTVLEELYNPDNTVSGAGITKGHYKAFCTIVDNNGTEGPMGIAKDIIVENDYSVIKWSDLPTVNTYSGLVSKKLYRSKAIPNGSTIDLTYYLVATISNTTDSEYIDKVIDTELTQAYLDGSTDANNFNDIIKCNIIERHPHSFRMFATGNPDNPMSVYYSRPNEPGYWENQNVLRVADGDGAIIALAAFGDSMLVFTSNHSIYVFRGIDPASDASWFKLPIAQSTVSPESICLTPSSLTFLGYGGIYSISPVVLDYQYVMQPGQDVMANLADMKIVSVVNKMSNLDKACAVWDPYNNRYLLTYASLGESENDSLLIFNWNTKSFTRIQGWHPISMLLYGSDLLIATSEGLFKAFNGSTDNGRDIQINVQTKKYDLAMPLNQKRLQKVYISSQVFIKYMVDIIADDTNFQRCTVNTDDISNKTRTEIKVRLRGYTFQLIFTNNNEQSLFNLDGIGFLFSPGRVKGIQSKDNVLYTKVLLVDKGNKPLNVTTEGDIDVDQT